jgi:hypothetical protein
MEYARRTERDGHQFALPRSIMIGWKNQDSDNYGVKQDGDRKTETRLF